MNYNRMLVSIKLNSMKFQHIEIKVTNYIKFTHGLNIVYVIMKKVKENYGISSR